jgi:hypothetical protein
MIICDFCGVKNPQRTYLCAPFLMMTIAGFEQWSDNAWAACDVCAGLIDNDRWEELSQRSLKTLPFRHLLDAEMRAQYKAMLVTMHQRFREAKGRVA